MNEPSLEQTVVSLGSMNKYLFHKVSMIGLALVSLASAQTAFDWSGNWFTQDGESVVVSVSGDSVELKGQVSGSSYARVGTISGKSWVSSPTATESLVSSCVIEDSVQVVSCSNKTTGREMVVSSFKLFRSRVEAMGFSAGADAVVADYIAAVYSTSNDYLAEDETRKISSVDCSKGFTLGEVNLGAAPASVASCSVSYNDEDETVVVLVSLKDGAKLNFPQ